MWFQCYNSASLQGITKNTAWRDLVLVSSRQALPSCPLVLCHRLIHFHFPRCFQDEDTNDITFTSLFLWFGDESIEPFSWTPGSTNGTHRAPEILDSISFKKTFIFIYLATLGLSYGM